MFDDTVCKIFYIYPTFGISLFCDVQSAVHLFLHECINDCHQILNTIIFLSSFCWLCQFDLMVIGLYKLSTVMSTGKTSRSM